MGTGEVYGPILDSLEIAMAEYGPDLRAVRWNATFERFFPEHVGRIHVGESYADNLLRFYKARLEGDDLQEVERLVAEGVQRHVQQVAPFEFTHRSRTLRVASMTLPNGGRVRIWKVVPGPQQAASVGAPAFDALENIADGACVLDARNRIVAANGRFRELYDVAENHPIVGETLDDVVARAWGPAAPFATLRAAIRNGLRYDGAPFLIEMPGDRWRRVVTRHADRDHAYLIHGDVTASQRHERDLRSLADQDGLTGLANRRSFDEVLRSYRPGSLLLVDADHFKAINDRHGHLVGDECLREIGAVLCESAAAENGHAARIGGEEFALLIPETSPERARTVAERVRLKVRSLDRGPALTVSIGVASGEAISLRETADRALYRAKANGRDRVEWGTAPVATAA